MPHIFVFIIRNKTRKSGLAVLATAAQKTYNQNTHRLQYYTRGQAFKNGSFGQSESWENPLQLKCLGTGSILSLTLSRISVWDFLVETWKSTGNIHFDKFVEIHSDSYWHMRVRVMLDLVCIRVCIYKRCVTSTKTADFTSLHMETMKCQTFNFFPNPK